MNEHDTSIPLCVDLDGTLVRSDTLVENLLCLLRQGPWAAVLIGAWLIGGRARFKAKLASRCALDVASLPANDEFLEWLRQQYRRGRRLVLCTAANHAVAEKVSARFGIFERVIASTDSVNLAGRSKAKRLIEEFGEQGFDYAGNERRDLHVWAAGRNAIIVAPTAALRRRLATVPRVEQTFPADEQQAGTWLRAMRIHQWSKNILIFLPAVASHSLIELPVLLASVLGFLIFGLCASGTYMLNDLMDLQADRQHPRKRKRPFASGELSLVKGLVVSFGLVGASLLLALAALGLPFFLVLSLYVAVTLWYSGALKRIAMVDVLVLASLYSTRVIAGSAATGIVPSFWLLAFSMFMFLSLAMAKRYAELKLMLSSGKSEISGRGYTADDLPLLQSSGLAAAYLSVLVLALYINSGAEVLYSRVEAIWLLCPLLLYWTSRVWLKTHRGQMHDDPVIFALTDRPSILTVGIAVVLILAAI